MTQQITIVATRPLTDSELAEVRDYAQIIAAGWSRPAASLTERNVGSHRSLPRRPATIERDGEIYIDADEVARMFAWFDPEKSSVDLVHEATEAEAQKYAKYFD